MTGHVFISYACKDPDFVLTLAGLLRGAGIPVWLDLVHLAAGGFTRLALDAKDQAVDDMFADRVEGKIARIFRTFPGIFELVLSGTYPGGAQDDWWEKQASLAADELPPFMQRLDDARKVRDKLRGASTHVEDAEAPICYVAGLPEPAAENRAVLGIPMMASSMFAKKAI